MPIELADAFFDANLGLIRGNLRRHGIDRSSDSGHSGHGGGAGWTGALRPHWIIKEDPGSGCSIRTNWPIVEAPLAPATIVVKEREWDWSKR
jgi:hypothetical protein